jgi:uncharacterized protein DUF3850
MCLRQGNKQRMRGLEHILKTWPEHYAAIERGAKTCELRLNDRPYQVGDALHLKEWEPLENSFTGRSCRVRVTHVLSGGAWLSPGYVAMSIRLMGEDGQARVQEDFRVVADAQRKELDELRASASLAVTRWKRSESMRAACLTRIQELEGYAQAVIDSAARELNYTEEVRLVSTAALRALGSCVSSNGGEHEPAPQTPEQAAAWEEERRLQKMAGLR